MAAQDKQGYPYFMLKEIYEQPQVMANTMDGMVSEQGIDMAAVGLTPLLQTIRRVYISGCGTAYHAGLVGGYAIEKWAGVPIEVEIASEFSRRHLVWEPEALLIVISQSGETSDTLGVVEAAKRHNIPVLAVTNVQNSTIARKADYRIYTQAGPEIAIASTKAYISQITVMYMLAMEMAKIRNQKSAEDIKHLAAELLSVPDHIQGILADTEPIKRVAEAYYQAQTIFYLGRNFDAATAKEGALKLKETSYIHAEAYPTGEIKHGPMALVEQNVPVVMVNTQPNVADISFAVADVLMKQGGSIIMVCSARQAENASAYAYCLTVPDMDTDLTPLCTVIVLQLLAYYIAVRKGNDVDSPRHLVKAVI